MFTAPTAGGITNWARGRPVDPDTAPATIVAGAAAVYLFAEPAYLASVAMLHDAPGHLLIDWNSTVAAAPAGNDWQDEIVGGGPKAVSPPGILIDRVALFNRGVVDLTYGQHFNVRGYR